MKKLKSLFKKGFTLVELVVVIAVIAILAGASVGIYFGVITKANKVALDEEARLIKESFNVGSVTSSSYYYDEDKSSSLESTSNGYKISNDLTYFYEYRNLFEDIYSNLEGSTTTNINFDRLKSVYYLESENYTTLVGFMYSPSFDDPHNYFFKKDDISDYKTISCYEYYNIKSSDTSKGSIVIEKQNEEYNSFFEKTIYDAVIYFKYSGNYDFDYLINANKKIEIDSPLFKNISYYNNGKIKLITLTMAEKEYDYTLYFNETYEVGIYSNNVDEGTIDITLNNSLKRRVIKDYNGSLSFNIKPKTGYKFSKKFLDKDGNESLLINLLDEPLVDGNTYTYIISDYSSYKFLLPIYAVFEETVDINKIADEINSNLAKIDYISLGTKLCPSIIFNLYFEMFNNDLYSILNEDYDGNKLVYNLLNNQVEVLNKSLSDFTGYYVVTNILNINDYNLKYDGLGLILNDTFSDQSINVYYDLDIGLSSNSLTLTFANILASSSPNVFISNNLTNNITFINNIELSVNINLCNDNNTKINKISLSNGKFNIINGYVNNICVNDADINTSTIDEVSINGASIDVFDITCGFNENYNYSINLNSGSINNFKISGTPIFSDINTYITLVLNDEFILNNINATNNGFNSFNIYFVYMLESLNSNQKDRLKSLLKSYNPNEVDQGNDMYQTYIELKNNIN